MNRKGAFSLFLVGCFVSLLFVGFVFADSSYFGEINDGGATHMVTTGQLLANNYTCVESGLVTNFTARIGTNTDCWATVQLGLYDYATRALVGVSEVKNIAGDNAIHSVTFLAEGEFYVSAKTYLVAILMIAGNGSGISVDHEAVMPDSGNVCAFLDADNGGSMPSDLSGVAYTDTNNEKVAVYYLVGDYPLSSDAPVGGSQWGVDPLIVTFALLIMDFVVALLFSRFAGKVGFFGGLTISVVVGNIVFPVYIPVWIPLVVGIVDFIVLYSSLKGVV